MSNGTKQLTVDNVQLTIVGAGKGDGWYEGETGGQGRPPLRKDIGFTKTTPSLRDTPPGEGIPFCRKGMADCELWGFVQVAQGGFKKF